MACLVFCWLWVGELAGQEVQVQVKGLVQVKGQGVQVHWQGQAHPRHSGKRSPLPSAR